MKQLFTFITILFAFNFAIASYNDLLELYELNATVEQAKETANIINLNAKTNDVNAILTFADTKLWYLLQTKPKIFIDIVFAENATYMGYFRLEYEAASKLDKITLIQSF